MHVEIRMPQLGMMMVEGTVLRWLVAEGARVEAGDDVLEIESDKVVQTITAPAAGIVRQGAPAGQSVPVLRVLGRILTDEERATAIGAELPVSRPASAEGPPIETAPAAYVAEIRASPIARRLAAERGIDLSTIKGTGPGGRIVEADVQAANQGCVDARAAPAWQVRQRIPLSGRRGVIAQRMMTSLGQSAQLTIVRECDASCLVRFRQQLLVRASDLGVRVRYDAILAKLLAVALTEQPMLNAVVDSDAVLVLAGVSVGVAMATPAGLVVPVIQDSDRRGLVDIARDLDRLARRAAQEQLLPEDLRGGTVTLSNMGLFGIDHFTPILNPPESAVLGVGSIASRPWVSGDQIGVRPTVHLSLTWDHRVADGQEAGTLLARIAALVQDYDYLSSLA